MPTAYFRAKYLWNRGEANAAFDLLRNAIEEQIGTDPFARPDYWLASKTLGAFEAFVANLFRGAFLSSARPLLLAPFGRAWSALWKLDRFEQWLAVLLEYDFFKRPEAVGFDEEEFAPPVNTDEDFEAIIHVLEVSARTGELSPNWEDQPNGGRPVLALEQLDAVDEARWGPLKPRLQARLAAAYAASPPDPWALRTMNAPEDVVIDLLHDLFGRNGSPNSAIEPRWNAIARGQQAYAAAARQALANLLSGVTPAHATDLVRFDAGRDVSDGLAWLQTLLKVLDTGVFSDLA